MTTGQLVMPETVPSSYWVRIVDHGIIATAARFLIVLERPDGYLVAWRDGVKPGHSGTLLKREQTEKAEKS